MDGYRHRQSRYYESSRIPIGSNNPPSEFRNPQLEVRNSCAGLGIDGPTGNLRNADMKLLCPCVIFVAALFAFSGCQKREISTTDRKQAANLISEAQFALTMKDYTRAEGLFVQATKLCPDTGDFWIGLGNTRVQLGQRDGARSAYQKALAAFADAAAKDKTDSEPALRQVYTLALLGRADDARALASKLPDRYPNDREVRAFVETKQIDRMLADPGFKQVAL